MKALQWIALGLVIATLYDRLHGFDLLADPVGWVLIGVGTRRLPASFARTGLTYLVSVAFVVSCVLWVPSLSDAIDAADPSLAWALSLPALAFEAWLCHQLAAAARESSERIAAQVLSGLVTLTAVVAVLPVLVFGGHVEGLDGLAGALAGLLPVLAVVVWLVYCGRSWAGAPVGQSPTSDVAP